MSRVNNHVICEWHYLVHQTVEQHSGQFLLRHMCRFLRKVRTSNVAEKQRVSGKNAMVFSVFILQ